MTITLRIAHLRIATWWAILRWAILSTLVIKIAVPNDPRSPFVTSGVRLGTPAVTTRGFKTEEIKLLSNWICDVIENINDDNVMTEIKNKVIKLTSEYPVYNL